MAPRHALDLEKLQESIGPVFQQVQHNVATHKKNVVTLHKIQAQAANITETSPKGIKLTGEKAFNDVFLSMINHLLPIKKGVVVADRVVKFVGAFVKYMNEKAAEAKAAEPSGDEDEDDDSTASRFVGHLLKYLLKGFEAKDKNVRLRVSQIVAELVSSLGEMDEDMYTALRASLLERIRDKESAIRVQVVIALAKLHQGEDPNDNANGQQPLTEVLVDILQFDPAPDVRRAALLNIPPLEQTLGSILSRTRDIDTNNRKILYHHLLTLIPNPRSLTISQRELIVRNGLGDREESVRIAAGRLVGGWADNFGGDLPEFLSIFDLVGSEVAEDALLSVFVTRPDLFDNVQMPESYWEDLTPEKAFLARVFAEHCIATKDEERLESHMPVVTALAFKIQAIYNDLLKRTEEQELLISGVPEDEDKFEEFRVDAEFLLGELFKLAVTLDYADEIGRRKMFSLVREMISQEALPEGLIVRCVDVLRKLSPNEKDLIRIVVEVVQELRDPGVNIEEEEDIGRADEETVFGETPARTRKKLFAAPAEPSEEDKEKAMIIDLRCLSLCSAMLERVNSTFEENSTLEGMLSELILPAVSSKNAELRGKGIICLGLCSLIHRKMAMNSFRLFTQQVDKAKGALRVNALKIVFDLLMVYPAEFMDIVDDAGDSLIVDFLLRVLDAEKEIQATACVGISKLMLAGMITDERLLRSLVLIYLEPEAADNQELRQCLSYFFPVYCYSSSENQSRMQKILIPSWVVLSEVYHELDEGEDMVTPTQVAGLLADWTDPQKAINVPGRTIDQNIHVELAIDVLKFLFKDTLEKEDKKMFCQLLGKLYIPDDVDDDQLRTLKLLMNNLKMRRPIRDTTTKNAFERFEKGLVKRFAKQLGSLNEEECRKMEKWGDIFSFVDGIEPLRDDDEAPPPKKRPARSRSKSTVPEGKSTKSKKPTSSRNKRSAATETDEDSGKSEELPAPRRRSTRAAATKKRISMESRLSEEEESSEASEQDKPKFRAKKTTKHKPKATEAELDAEIDSVLDKTQDSIGDSAGEDDEELEVEGELLEDDDD